jgi:hypothetical protein
MIMHFVPTTQKKEKGKKKMKKEVYEKIRLRTRSKRLLQLRFSERKKNPETTYDITPSTMQKTWVSQEDRMTKQEMTCQIQVRYALVVSNNAW